MFPDTTMRMFLIVAMSVALSGCYYLQAAQGQLQVLNKRVPIAELIQDPEIPDDLGARLQLIVEARRFSINELGLPDNDSYLSYSDIGRDFVVWNVYAAPEFSLEPKRWCYPIVGCVSYRGYFSEDAANRVAAKLGKRGYDVAVGGVTAYSTLGRFDDPVLNTMMRWNDVQLVAVLFHELAHQLLYIKDDTAFNESFATAVEEVGIKRWLEQRGRHDEMAAYRKRKELHRRLVRLADVAGRDLNAYFSETLDPDEKRLLKEHRLELLSANVAAELQEAGRTQDHWLSGKLNNAHLIPMTLYEGRVPAFRALLAACHEDIECFYSQSRMLSGLDKPERESRLDELASQDVAARSPRDSIHTRLTAY